MLVARRSTEKNLTKSVDSLSLSWMQQAFALPFIVVSLFFAPFFLPQELSAPFWGWMVVYVVLSSVDIYCYFKALSLADVSYVAPLLSLVSVGNIAGAYLVLGQKPSSVGILGAVLVVVGAYIINRAKLLNSSGKQNNKAALLLVLMVVLVRSYYSNVELFMTRESNPTTFNFYSSLITVPLLFLVAYVLRYRNNITENAKRIRAVARVSFWPLLFIGLTYTLNMLATYQGKLISPNAGYVAAVKSASVVPMVLVGVLFFHEKVVSKQWLGITVIVAGLVLLGLD